MYETLTKEDIMGWWDNGKSAEGKDMVWGDTPADQFDEALEKIDHIFESAWDRKPTVEELRRGLEFALGGRIMQEVMESTREQVTKEDEAAIQHGEDLGDSIE